MSRSSDYYPPRAGWLSSLRGARYRAAAAFEQAVPSNRFKFTLSVVDTLLSVALPGYVFKAHGMLSLGALIGISYTVLLAIYVVGLGYSVANIAFGLLISLHATSISFFWTKVMVDWSFRWKIALAITSLLATWMLIYAPAQERFAKSVTPLRTTRGVVVVHAGADPANIRRGDAIAYRVNEYIGQQIYIGAGFGMGRVQAVAGDRIIFSEEFYEINGVRLPREDYMPRSGELLVPQHHWFVWPHLAMQQIGLAAEIQISQILAHTGMIGEDEFAGKVFDRWFWRKQSIP